MNSQFHHFESVSYMSTHKVVQRTAASPMPLVLTRLATWHCQDSHPPDLHPATTSTLIRKNRDDQKVHNEIKTKSVLAWSKTEWWNELSFDGAQVRVAAVFFSAELRSSCPFFKVHLDTILNRASHVRIFWNPLRVSVNNLSVFCFFFKISSGILKPKKLIQLSVTF